MPLDGFQLFLSFSATHASVSTSFTDCQSSVMSSTGAMQLMAADFVIEVTLFEMTGETKKARGVVAILPFQR